MSCLTININRVSEHLDVKCNAMKHLEGGVTSIGTHLDVKCVKVCDVAIVKWLPLYSSDGYALVDVNGLILLAK
jgi:hypothetical protein